MEVLAVSIVAAVMASISAFTDGHGLFRRWRDKRRAKKQAMVLFAGKPWPFATQSIRLTDMPSRFQINGPLSDLAGLRI